MFRQPHSFTLNVTNDCTMRCSYCYSDKVKGTLKTETAKKFIDTLKDLSDEKYLTFTFFGGEPLMASNRVVDIVNNYMEDERIRFTIITNGSIYHPSIVRVVNKKDISFNISIDVSEKIHNKTRVGINSSINFNLVRDNVRKYIEELKHPITLNVAITKELMDNVDELISFYEEFKSKTNFHFYDIKGVIKYSPEDMESFLECLKDKKPSILNEYLTPLEKDEIKTYNPFSCDFISDSYSLDPNGDVHMCKRLKGHEDYQLGNINTEVNFGKINELLPKNHISNFDECRACDLAFYYCDVSCVGSNYELTGHINKVDTKLCAIQRVKHNFRLKENI